MSGSLVALIGAGFVVMYILGAVVNRLGEPDQSLLFWYLPILFIGLIGAGLGGGLGIWGGIRLRNIRKQGQNNNSQPGSGGDGLNPPDPSL